MVYSEDKGDNDFDEPWIMTVKGLHFNNFKQKESEEPLISQSIKYNGAKTTSPRDLNLNHYKSNQVTYTFMIIKIVQFIKILFIHSHGHRRHHHPYRPLQ